MRAGVHGGGIGGLALSAAALLLCAGAASSDSRGLGRDGPPIAAERFALDADTPLGPLVTEAAGGPEMMRRLWTRVDLATLAERIRERLAADGALTETLRLVLREGRGTSAGFARFTLAQPAAGATRPAGPAGIGALAVSVVGCEGIIPEPERLFAGAGADLRPIARLEAGLRALRAAARERGHLGAEARLDSIAGGAAGARAYVRLLAGPPVRLESIALPAGAITRPGAAAAIAGLRAGGLLTPRALEQGRERLAGSGLFTVVGALEVRPGIDPSHARVYAPVEEARMSRFEGGLGFRSGGGLTGLADLAIGNIGGTGRSAGARWAGIGAGRSDYAVRYREPALLGRDLDATLALEARVLDSLYTQTRWSLRLGARPAPRARAALGVERGGTVYEGLGRGSSGDWTVEGTLAWDGLEPRANPIRGVSISSTTQLGRRVDRIPGLPAERHGVVRASACVEGARSTGDRRALYAAMRAEGVALGGDRLPAEELRYIGGRDGLRGHPDRAFGGDRIVALTLEHRWLAEGPGARSYLFFDAARHSLGAPLRAGLAAPAGAFALPGPLARTALSGGWDFGYGAGLRARAAAGTIGIELGLRPGASIRESQLHVRYASTW